jgi:hypothetical protein
MATRPEILQHEQKKVPTMSIATPQEQILGIVNNHWQSCCVMSAGRERATHYEGVRVRHFDGAVSWKFVD